MLILLNEALLWVIMFIVCLEFSSLESSKRRPQRHMDAFFSVIVFAVCACPFELCMCVCVCVCLVPTIIVFFLSHSIITEIHSFLTAPGFVMCTVFTGIIYHAC